MLLLASKVARLKWCALAVTAITFLSLMPQLRFWIARGSQWQGADLVLQPDEILYSAYVNALIDGRPRRNDPATGQDDHRQAPLPESLFSIQFIPAYALALPARAFGASASTAFILLTGAAGLLASLSIYWLLASVLGDRKVAAIGVLLVLCFGSVAAGQGLVGLLLKEDVKFLGLPFLRRYEPAAPFPLFFVFCTLIWQALTSTFKRRAIMKALLAGGVLDLLIFSYFYLWTAAVAWVACAACLWLFFRPLDRWRSIRLFIVVTLPVILPLVCYFYLLTHRPPALDKAQVLSLTHWPDLLHLPEMIGAFVLALLLISVRRQKVSFNEPQVIFAASFALLPMVVLNQQLVTGRSLQPFHYDVLIGNYVVLIGAVMLLRFFQPMFRQRVAVSIVVACLLWGTVEVNLSFQANYKLGVRNDEMVPVLLHLREQAKHDGTWEGLREEGKTPTLLFSPQYGISTLLPSWAPQGSLLAPGSVSFQSLAEAQRKEWLFMHFYYCGMDGNYLVQLLNDRVSEPFLTHFARNTIFGPERVVMFLGWDFQPIRQDEIQQEVRGYEIFAKSFSHEEAAKRPLTYAITYSDGKFDFSNLDRWYVRDGGERVGAYTLYRLALRK